MFITKSKYFPYELSVIQLREGHRIGLCYYLSKISYFHKKF